MLHSNLYRISVLNFKTVFVLEAPRQSSKLRAQCTRFENKPTRLILKRPARCFLVNLKGFKMYAVLQTSIFYSRS